MDISHTCLVTKNDPRDWLAGDGNITYKSNIPSGDWSSHYFFDSFQKINGFETDGCVLWTANESVDAQIDFLISTGQVSAETLNFFTQLGFMDVGIDQKVHFHSSPRATEYLTGNQENGNALQDPWQVFQKYGLIPWKLWPFDGTITPLNYLDPIPQDILNVGQQFLIGIGGKSSFQYHWITQNGVSFATLDSARQQAPVCLGVNIGNDWNEVCPPPPASASPAGHSVGNISSNTTGEQVFDHYVPFVKTFIPGWPILQAFQGVISITPPPPAPVPPAPIPQMTVQQDVSWLQAVTQWLNNLLGTLSGSKVAANTILPMSYNAWISKTNWSMVALVAVTITQAVVPFMSAPVQTVVTAILGAFIAIFHVQGVQKAAVSSAALGVPVGGQ